MSMSTRNHFSKSVNRTRYCTDEQQLLGSGLFTVRVTSSASSGDSPWPEEVRETDSQSSASLCEPRGPTLVVIPPRSPPPGAQLHLPLRRLKVNRRYDQSFD